MKKILFVINTLGLAGAEKALIELLRSIDPKKYRIDLFVLLNQGELIGEIPDYVNILNSDFDACPIHTAEGQRHLLGRSIKALLHRGTLFRCLAYIVSNLISMIKEHRVQCDKLLWKAIAQSLDPIKDTYDLAVAFVEGGSTYFVGRKVNAKKKVAWIHIAYGIAGYNKRLDEGIYDFYDRVYGVSEEVCDSFVNVYPEKAPIVNVFHNIVNVDAIKKRSLEDAGFDDNFEGIRILSVGRLVAQKAYEVSIDAIKILKDRGIKLRYYILGEGNRRETLEEYIEKLGLSDTVLLYGNRLNPYPYIRQSDIFLHASKYEGKSIAIQEARILGKPIIVSDCEGNREQIRDGIDGVVCDFAAEGIAEALSRLISDETFREALGSNAGVRILGELDKTEEIRGLLELV